jgi:hypothetical protein
MKKKQQIKLVKQLPKEVAKKEKEKIKTIDLTTLKKYYNNF